MNDDELAAHYADPVTRRIVRVARSPRAPRRQLAELREARGVTQSEIATAVKMTQQNVSRIEYADDMYLSTLRRYVEALGGRLELHAVFPDAIFEVTVGSSETQ